MPSGIESSNLSSSAKVLLFYKKCVILITEVFYMFSVSTETLYAIMHSLPLPSEARQIATFKQEMKALRALRTSTPTPPSPRYQPVRKTETPLFGSREEVITALTCGGKTIADIARAHGVSGSRQAIHQKFFRECGVKIDDLKNQRTKEWYARRLAGDDETLLKKLLDTEWIKKRLAESSLNVVSTELHIPIYTFHKYVKAHLGIKSVKKSGVTELVCAEETCGKTFFRANNFVRRDKKETPDKKTFCNKVCYGKYFARYHGFGAHPEHRKYKKKGEVTEESH
jgi:hypothetical protein